MTFNSSQMIPQLREDFERLLAFVTGPQAQTATMDQMERSLFRQVLHMGYQLLRLFVMRRAEAESHAPLVKRDKTVLPYHSQKGCDYFSIFGKLRFERAYFYAWGGSGQCREGEHICQRVALTDGAEPLQKQMLTCLPGFPLVLDIIHAVEYLWKAGTALYGETDPYRAEWVEAQTLQLLSSHTDQVIQLLEDKADVLPPNGQAARSLRGVSGYFRRNQSYMNYAEYLCRGWPIGTGVIEGTCRHLVKDRMELSGMR